MFGVNKEVEQKQWLRDQLYHSICTRSIFENFKTKDEILSTSGDFTHAMVGDTIIDFGRTFKVHYRIVRGSEHMTFGVEELFNQGEGSQRSVATK